MNSHYQSHRKLWRLSLLTLSFFLSTTAMAYSHPSGVATIKILNYTNQNIDVGLRNFGNQSDISAAAETSTGAFNFTSTSTSAYPIPSQDAVPVDYQVNGAPGELMYSFTNLASDEGNTDYDNSSSIKLNRDMNQGCYGLSPWQMGLGTSNGACFVPVAGLVTAGTSNSNDDAILYYNDASTSDAGSYDNESIGRQAPRVDVILGSGASMVTYSISVLYLHDTGDWTNMTFMNGNNVLTSVDGQNLFVVCADAPLHGGYDMNTNASLSPTNGYQDDGGMTNATITLSIYPLGPNTSTTTTDPLTGEILSTTATNKISWGPITNSAYCPAQRYPVM